MRWGRGDRGEVGFGVRLGLGEVGGGVSLGVG